MTEKIYCKCWKCEKVEEIFKESNFTYRCRKCGADVTVNYIFKLKQLREALG